MADPFSIVAGTETLIGMFRTTLELYKAVAGDKSAQDQVDVAAEEIDSLLIRLWDCEVELQRGNNKYPEAVQHILRQCETDAKSLVKIYGSLPSRTDSNAQQIRKALGANRRNKELQRIIAELKLNITLLSQVVRLQEEAGRTAGDPSESASLLPSYEDGQEAGDQSAFMSTKKNKGESGVQQLKVPKKHNDYTVGWICASPTERAAAAAMLDEEHPKLQHHPRDGNAYTLGRIGEHNVVIASLPAGHYGSTATAVVARDTLWSFPAVRIGLLVGIGGGAPSSKHDIRLGDVVVGTPTSNSNGVVQYDTGKMHSGGVIERTGSLNAPPKILLLAISRMQVMDARAGLSLGEVMSEAQQRYPRLNRDFAFPGHQQDLLFDSNYRHVDNKDDCSICDPDRLVPRPERKESAAQVHYGIIGTGNIIIKDAQFRDEISQTLGVLCFEMEAAGLMNDFPCLVIKGIADYSDSHKNKKWQRYAAFTAAAYAKSLLNLIPASDIEDNIEAARTAERYELEQPEPIGQDNSDTSSIASTLVGSLDFNRVDAAIAKVSEILANDAIIKSLCLSAILRIHAVVLQSNLVSALVSLSTFLKKSAQTPKERELAWLFRRYRPLIATRITEIICGPHAGSLSLVLPQEEPSIIPTTQVTEELSSLGLKTLTPTTATEAVPSSIPVEADERETQDFDEELEPDAQDYPEDASFDDLDESVRILNEGYGLQEMYEKLKVLLFPPVPQLIKRVLDRNLVVTEQTASVGCLIEWELLQFIQYEDLEVSDIDFIFTMNGEFDRASASSLKSYMESTWRNFEDLLATVKLAVAAASDNVFDAVHTVPNSGPTSVNRTELQLVPPRTNEEKEYALALISGSVDYVYNTLEQLAWLAATLRLHCEGRLTISYVDFRAMRFENEHQIDADFQLSLWNQDQLPWPETDKMGQCWTALFTESVLAYGFPSGDDRPEAMIGLEIPFEVMASFAGVKFPILFGKRLCFSNSHSALIPVIGSGDSIQWHFDTVENLMREAPTVGKTSDPSVRHLDVSRLSGSRAFLGYNKNSTVVIGTADFDDTTIGPSEVSPTGPAITFDYTGPVGVSVNAKSYASVSMGTTWKFRKGESCQIKHADLNTDDLFHGAARSLVLIYDMEDRIAYLLPELSVALQMATNVLRKKQFFAKHKITYARAHFDGGEAAFDALTEGRGLVVPLDTGGQVEYTDFVKQFLTVLEQRSMQQKAHREYAKVRFHRRNLGGWDYTDVQNKVCEIFERELPTEWFKSRPFWWDLCHESDTVVLFCRGIAYPIRGQRNSDNPCCISWSVIPDQNDLLLANVKQLEILKAKICQKGAKKYPARYMMTNDLAWARPAHSRLFEDNCRQGGSCNPLQTMCSPTMMKLRKAWPMKLHYLDHPGALEPTGSALFADDPSDFDAKICQFLHVPPDELQVNWNIIALGSICIALLAYLLSKVKDGWAYLTPIVPG